MSPKSRIRIALYGDSLSLPRPGVVSNGQRYIMCLHDALEERLGVITDVLDRGEGGGDISMLKNRIIHDKNYYRDPGYLALIQSGIVDCAPRPVSNEMRERIGRLPSFIRKRVIKYLHNNRTKIVLRRFFVRTELAKFQSDYQESLAMLTKNYESVFCINICPAPEAFEKVSPGVSCQIDAYNQVIKAVVSAVGAKLVDVHSMIRSGGDIYDYIVRDDDHHITALTHQMISSQVLDHLPQTHSPSKS